MTLGEIASRGFGRFHIVRGKPAPHGVFGDAAGEEEFVQVVGAAGLGADARELEAAEGLAVDQGAGDGAVDVEVSHTKLAFHPFDVGRAA